MRWRKFSGNRANTPKLEQLYRRALASGTRYLGADNPIVAFNELRYAKLLHATGRNGEVQSMLTHASMIAYATGNRALLWQVEGELTKVYAPDSLANSFQAIFFGKEAVNELQTLRGNLATSSAEAQQVATMVKEQEYFDFTHRSADADAPKTVASLNSSEKQLHDLDRKYIELSNEYGALQEQYNKEGDDSAPRSTRVSTCFARTWTRPRRRSMRV